MDPRHPPVPSPATHHAQSHASGHSSPANTDYYDYDSEPNDKDAYASKLSTRDDRASRSTAGRAHDSVLSPFSPHPSAPNSPGSSVSSAARRAPLDIHDARSHRVSPPPRAHLDPEKAASYDAYEARSPHRPAPDAVVYDKTEYHDQGPEDKAWQLLVCRTRAPLHPPPDSALTRRSSTSPAPALSSPSP